MIIGVVGFLGSGKGTVADILVETYDFKKISFADTVKDAVAAIFGWPRYLLEGDTDESRAFRESKDVFWSARFGYDVTPRYMLQLMGTEAGRDVFHKELWIHALEKRVKNILEEDEHSEFVIPDVRFPNEMAFIRDMGGFIVRVKRGPEPEWFDHALHDNAYKSNEKMGNYYPNVHYSEWAWIGEKFDYEISNNGSLGMLEADVNHLLKIFTGPAIMQKQVA